MSKRVLSEGGHPWWGGRFVVGMYYCTTNKVMYYVRRTVLLSVLVCCGWSGRVMVFRGWVVCEISVWWVCFLEAVGADMIVCVMYS